MNDATKAIWLEWRSPNVKRENKLYGETRYLNPNTARVFINNRKSRREISKTFWHEMFHVFCHFHGHSFTAQKEEDMARRLESIVWELIR
jgi:Zn-dependent peptidase ImmA (M78 family)